MNGQRQRASRNRRRRQKSRSETNERAEPIMIAARRPNSPHLVRSPVRGAVAASASPSKGKNGRSEGGPLREVGAEPLLQRSNGNGAKAAFPQDTAPRRVARIVQIARPVLDDRAQQRERLLDRLRLSEGRGAISRAANALREAGFEFPVEQEVQLQLLEHFDEDFARIAIENLSQLVSSEPPIKRPIFEQRLRRLEEYADDASVREAAASLRRTVRA